MKRFTLIELLAVIAITALLAGLLLPVLARGRNAARIARAHGELRGITVALILYRTDFLGLPPTRASCNTHAIYELPLELIGYLPGGSLNDTTIARVPDVFHPELGGYKYRAPGPAIFNEYTFQADGGTLWVPNGFPGAETETGQYYTSQAASPVRYAVWSWGPDPDSPKLANSGRAPIPRQYWLRNSGDTGVIVHYENRDGQMHASP
jgi:type II secretory pathway pseudopilin PulG